MYRADIRCAFLIIFLTCIAGCASTNFVEIGKTDIDHPNPGVLHALSSNKIVIIERRDEGNIHYNKDGAIYFASYHGEDSVIVGSDAQGTLSVTKLNRVNRVWIEEKQVNTAATLLVVGGVVVTALYIAFIIEMRDGFYDH